MFLNNLNGTKKKSPKQLPYSPPPPSINTATDDKYRFTSYENAHRKETVFVRNMFQILDTEWTFEVLHDYYQRAKLFVWRFYKIIQRITKHRSRVIWKKKKHLFSVIKIILLLRVIFNIYVHIGLHKIWLFNYCFIIFMKFQTIELQNFDSLRLYHTNFEVNKLMKFETWKLLAAEIC